MYMSKRLGVVVQWYVPDGWYGERYRAILTLVDGIEFRTKGEASRYRSEFRKVVQQVLAGVKLSASQCMVVDVDILKVYEHVSFGPSISYVHFNYVVDGGEYKLVSRTN